MSTVWVHVTAGRGPAECHWVVAQVVRELEADARGRNIEVELLEAIDGDERGTLKSALLSLDGAHVAALLGDWEGTVQWIGKSPYRPNHKRRNWFVGVETLRPVEAPSWSAHEVRLDTFRASGPGGQHVNTSDTAVRVTHVPTGLQCVASEERSQRRNKALAFARLAEALEAVGEAREAASRKARWDQHNALERGNAVRVYRGPRFRLR